MRLRRPILGEVLGVYDLGAIQFAYGDLPEW